MQTKRTYKTLDLHTLYTQYDCFTYLSLYIIAYDLTEMSQIKCFVRVTLYYRIFI